MKIDSRDAVANELGNTRPDFKSAALEAYEAGFDPIPILPGSKQPTRRWAPWRKNLSKRTIRRYWKKHPDHEVGILLTDAIIVYDADTPEGVAALYNLEENLDLTPNLIAGTKRGEHHYFSRATATKARSDAPDKTLHPERIDIKTGKALIIIPPSTGKHYILNKITTVNDLVEFNQEQIDTFDRHNGRKPSSISPNSQRKVLPTPDIADAISELRSLVDHLDPDKGYSNWLNVLMAIFNRSRGSAEGLALAIEWSSKGKKYDGPEEIEYKWESFDLDHENPVTMATLYRMVEEQMGKTRYREIYNTLGPQWDLSSGDTVITSITAQPGDAANESVNPLLAFSLKGQSASLKKEFANHELVFGRIAIRGQWTVLYAPPNTGKTLLMLWLIVEAIKKKIIGPQHLFYINADDGGSGIADKAGMADKYGFHLVVPGHSGFKTKDLQSKIIELTATSVAAKTIIVLDTLKKFTNIMNKTEQRNFDNAVRAFTAKGGTVIGLAHTNKNRDGADKLVYSGTTDIIDDADCVYILDILSDIDGVRTVELENRKNRGDVARKPIYQYSTAEGQSYKQLLQSVAEVDPKSLDQLRNAIEFEASGDKLLIELVKGFIAQGINTKTALVKELAKQDGVSKSRATGLIEKYTGNEPIKYRWSVKTEAHNKQVFTVLSVTSPNPEPAPKKAKTKKHKGKDKKLKN